MNASGFTITVLLDLSTPLRVLLERLLPLLAGAPADTVSRAVTGAAGEPGAAGGELGSPVSDVSSQTAPAAAAPPPAPLSRPERKAAARRGGRRSKYDTEKRISWLKTAWPDGISLADAFVELNKLPGVILPAPWAVKSILAAHDIRRSPEFLRATQLRKVALMRLRPGGAVSRATVAATPPVGDAPAKPPPSAQRPARVITAAQVAARRSAVPLKPIQATSLEILHWGAEHGCRQDVLDLEAMNAHCRRLKVAEFELVGPRRKTA